MLRDHVAEDFQGSAVDTGRAGQPEDVLGSPVVGGPRGVDRQRTRGAEKVHQIGRDVAHGLCDGDPAVHVGCTHGRLQARHRTAQPVIGRDDAGNAVDGIGGQQDLLGHGGDLLQAAGLALDGAVLGVERLTQHRPASVHFPDAVLVVDPHVGVEGDVGAVTVDRADGLDLHAGRIHGHQEHGEALMFRRGRVGVGDQEDVLGVLGVRGEHLGAIDDPR